MERYEREKSLPIYWYNRANDLRGAAGAVWFAMENERASHQIHDLLKLGSGYSFSAACHSSFLMLCGLSFELLYKALAIYTGERPPAIHDLRALAVRAKLALTADDLELMDVLSDHAVWAGRYPIPKGDRREWDQHRERMEAALWEPVPDVAFRYCATGATAWIGQATRGCGTLGVRDSGSCITNSDVIDIEDPITSAERPTHTALASVKQITIRPCKPNLRGTLGPRSVGWTRA